MKVLEKDIEYKKPDHLSDLIFQHHSPKKLNIISPQKYSTIFDDRSDNMDLTDVLQYIKERIDEEEKYKNILNDNSKNSFIYATIVGFNKMESAQDYPGFTYYFKLDDSQMNECLFGVIDSKKVLVPIQKGIDSLTKCLLYWNESKDKLKVGKDELLGIIEPRIEVVLPISVKPFAMVPEIEMR